MSWESSETYQQLVEMHPDLNENYHRDAFDKFLERMWTKPATFSEFAQAYMEFTTKRKLTFPKLKALEPAETKNTRSRTSRRSRRRSSRRKKNSSKS
jgi:hypothetical protein